MLNFKLFACNALEAVIVSQTSSCEFLPSCMEPHSAGSHAKYCDRTIRPLALSIGLDASPSSDMEATRATLETLKKSATSGSKRSVPSSKDSPIEAKNEESSERTVFAMRRPCQRAQSPTPSPTRR